VDTPRHADPGQQRLDDPVATGRPKEHGERAMTAASLLEGAAALGVQVLRGGPADWQAATGRPLARR
jgi:hypothetical protein